MGFEIQNDTFRDFHKSMDMHTAPFPADEFITPEALYSLASIGGNTETIPFIPFPKDFNAERSLSELTPVYINESGPTALAQEVILAIAWMQQAEYVAILNEATFFYQKDALPVSVVGLNKENTKLRLAYREKATELLGVLGVFEWMNQPLKKQERFICQKVTVQEVMKRFEHHTSMSLSLYEKGKVIVNAIFFDCGESVVKYNVIEETIEEKAGREWLKEIMKQLHIYDAFDFENKHQDANGF